MKTYSRKKPEFAIIENINQLCRLCLKNYENMLLLFPDNDQFIARKITLCLGFKIIKEEHLPNRICLKCYEIIDSWQKFKTLCEAVNHKLELHLNSINCTNNEIKVNQIEYIKEEHSEVVKENKNIENHTEDIVVKLDNAHCSKQSSQEQNNMEDDFSITDKKIDEKEEIKNEICQPYDISAHIMEGLVKCGLVQMQDGLMLTNCPVGVQLVTEDGELVTLELENVEDEVQSDQFQLPKYDLKISAQVDSKVTCGQCGKSFSNRTVLERHKKVHSGEKPYKCLICQRAFAQKEVLDRHKLTHSVIRPHKCNICPKSFTQKANLVTHERSHWSPAERPICLHNCPTCGKMFLYPSGLSRHLLSHAGVHYKCDVCNKSFRDRSSLKRHIVRLHQGNKRDQQEEGET